MTKNSGSFSKDNQPVNRPGKGKTERTKILEAMERAGKTEEGFYDLLVKEAANKKSVKNAFVFKELLLRLSPIPKQVHELVNFTFPKNAKPHEQAEAVLGAIANGIIPSDIGNMFIQSIKSMIDIEEYTSLKNRIEEIERSLGVDGG